MMKFLVGMILGLSVLMGGFDIKIGVFSNAKNLQNNIKKITSTKYRKAIIVEKKRHLSYVHAIINGTRSDAKKALLRYQKVFPDAFISQEKSEKLLPPQKKKSVKKLKRAQLHAKKILLHKTMYVCYEDAPIGLSGQLVKMHFLEDKIAYLRLGKNTPLDISYTLEQNTIRLKISALEMQHKIVSDKGDYFLVYSYVKEKKMHTLRYYKMKTKALEYISKR